MVLTKAQYLPLVSQQITDGWIDHVILSSSAQHENDNDSENDSDKMDEGDDEPEPATPQYSVMPATWRVIKPAEGQDLSSIKEALARSARASAMQSGTSRCNGNMGLSEADRKARALAQKDAEKSQRGASGSSSSAHPLSDLINWLESDDAEPFSLHSKNPVSPVSGKTRATPTPHSDFSNLLGSEPQSRSGSVAAREGSNSDDASSSNGGSASNTGAQKPTPKRRPGPSGLITTAKRAIKREPGLPAFMTPPHIAAAQSTSRVARKIEDIPLTCTACIQEGFVSRTYQRRTNLNRHIRECHTPGREPLPCLHPGCGMGFSNNYSLRRHQRHLGHLPEGEL